MTDPRPPETTLPSTPDLPRGILPSWRAPRRDRTPDPDLTAAELGDAGYPAELGDLPEPTAPSTVTTRAFTGTSGSPTKRELELGARAAALVIGLVFVGVSLVLRRRDGARVFRRPTREQLDEIAAPVGRIAVRHLPAVNLTDDLLDAAEAASALTDWLDGGPLMVPGIDPGVTPQGDDDQ